MADMARSSLTRFERWGVYLTLAVVVIFGGLVEFRSAFLSRRMGDLGCYLRGAWAVRAGTNLYEIEDDNRWHYNYPPFFAIMVTPLADPPRGVTGDFVVPYRWTVALWYLANIACLVWAAHGLATALEEHASDANVREQPRYCRRWWALRLWPVAVCIAPIGHTLMRSQVNILVLALLCSMTTAFLRGQRFRAGIWLATATAIKVIPIYLLVYPLLRRDRCCLLGFAAGSLVTLVAIPVLALGPDATVSNYRVFAQTLLGPALKLGNDESRNQELLGTKSTDNQSLQNTLFNLRYPSSLHRPTKLEPWALWTQRVLGTLMTVVTLAAGYRAGFRPGWPLVLFVGAMMYLMTILGPVCHLHYFVNMLPLVMALLAARWEFRDRLWLGRSKIGLFAVFCVANCLPNLPWLEDIRAMGLPLIAGLGLWGLAVWRLWLAAELHTATVPVDENRTYVNATRWGGPCDDATPSSYRVGPGAAVATIASGGSAGTAASH